MGRVGSFAAGLLLATTSAAEERAHLVLAQEGVRAEIAEVAGRRARSRAVEVTLTSGGQTTSWRYEDTWLDPAATDAPVAELAPAGARTLLLVRAYSGGAACCWFLLAFDIEGRAALGRQADSLSAIRIARGEHRCALGAAAVPPRPACSLQAGGNCKAAFLCFDGVRFRELPGVTPSLDGPAPGRSSPWRVGAGSTARPPEPELPP
jgi:hypothetical protein